jgi:hypothetical protein
MTPERLPALSGGLHTMGEGRVQGLMLLWGLFSVWMTI